MAETADRLPQSAPALPGAHALFTPEVFLPELSRRLAEAPDARTVRSLTVQILAQARADAMADIVAGFRSHPRAARETVRAIASLTDATVVAVHHVATTILHPNTTPTDAEKLAVLAIGGYGRAEMAPQSDVDLLFLTPWKITAWAESVVESMLYMLWDLKLKVGQSTRTIDDCIRLGGGDITIRTSLLEHRLVCGHAATAETLRDRLWSDLFDNSVPEFIEAKLAERAERHRRQGGQRYVLEPNVKEGKGGLRDLQTLYWIAKYIHRVDRAAELVELGFFTRDEHLTFWQAEDFLWAVRCHLHLLSGRPTDQLTFDMQVEVARAMGYRDQGGRRAVEIFMQHYFLHATRVGELTRVFLVALEDRHLYKAPILKGWLSRRKRVAAGFSVDRGRLNYADERQFLSDPLNILRLFQEALRTGLLLHSDAMRTVAANLDLIDDHLRQDPEAVRIFLDLLLKHGNPERSLRRMNELGLLGAFIPEFAPVVAMMQFNVYHHYTVDEHLIQCVAALSEIDAAVADVDERAARLPQEARARADAVRATVEEGLASLSAASRKAAGSPRSRPSETITTAAPRAYPPNRGTARNACNASPMRVPPSQSLTRNEAAFSACSRRFSRSAGVTRVSRVPKVNTSTLPAACTSACASRMFSSVRAFIEPETSIRNRIDRKSVV